MTSGAASTNARDGVPDIAPEELEGAGSWPDVHNGAFEQQPSPCDPQPGYESKTIGPGQGDPTYATEGTAWDAVGPGPS